jgi:phosphatidylinositol glycan class B
MLADGAPWLTHRRATLGLSAIVFCAFLLRLLIGLTEHGIHWPDEIYQTLEPAHYIVYGHGLLPWEFAEGARNWALPGLLAGVLAVARVVGIDEPAGYLAVVRAFLAAIGAGTVAATYLLARVHGASRAASLAGAAAAAFAAPIVFFGHRAFSEVVSALPVTLGLAFGLWALQPAAPDARRRRLLVLGAGALLGLAVVLRLQNAVFAAGLLVAFLAARRWRDAGLLAAVLCAWLVALGVLDLLTWGHFLWSVRQYFEYNVVSDVAARIWGRSAAWYYAARMLETAPLMTLLLVAGTAAAWRRAPALLAIVAVYLLAHVVTAHKELRFIVPALPAACALGAIGLDAFATRLNPRLAQAAVAVFAAVAVSSAFDVRSLTAAQVGADGQRDATSAWRGSDAVNRLLLRASSLSDLCGLKVQTVPLYLTGGLTYLHRPVHLYGGDGPPRDSRFYNYVIVPAPPPGATGVIARREGLALERLGPGCLPDPGYRESLGPAPSKD